jgi:signal peptidase II
LGFGYFVIALRLTEKLTPAKLARTTRSQGTHAMDSPARSYRWLFWLLAVVGLTVDLGSKYAIFHHLYNDGAGGEIPIIPGAFRIHVVFDGYDDSEDLLHTLRGGKEFLPYVNKGALFGVGQGKNIIFGIVSVAAAVFIIGWSLRDSARRDWFLCTSLGLILAGTLGNLYDRLIFDGVRDFLHWYKWYNWPVFNVADMCLVAGASMLLLEAFLRKPEEIPEPQPTNAVGV